MFFCQLAAVECHDFYMKMVSPPAILEADLIVILQISNVPL